MEAEGSSPYLQTTVTYSYPEPDQSRPYCPTHLHCLCCTKREVQVRGNAKCFVLSQASTVKNCWHFAKTPSWKATPCQLSTTAYSAYSLLTSIPGSRSSNGKLRTRHAVVKGTQEPQHEKGVLTTKPQNTTKHEKSPKPRNKSHTFFENILRNTVSTC
jgi:hypothetical protein